MRVVSLTCSNTEIVSALGCSNRLVGVDDHSDYPEEVVKALPRVGPDLDIDIEKVTALKPDLVLASLTVPGHEKVIANLKQAGLHYLAPAPVCIDDIYSDIGLIADALGVANKGNEVIDAMRSTLRPSAHKTNHAVLVQWWPKPVIAPGKYSWVDGLLSKAGLTNPLFDEEVKSMPLTDEQVASLNPDAIVLSWCGVKPEKYRPDVLYRNEHFKSMDAIMNRRIFCVPEAYLGRPSPRIVEGYRAFCAIAQRIKA